MHVCTMFTAQAVACCIPWYLDMVQSVEYNEKVEKEKDKDLQIDGTNVKRLRSFPSTSRKRYLRVKDNLFSFSRVDSV